MPFFEKSKVLVIHIPKTGGTSIEQYFGKKEYENFDISKRSYEYFDKIFYSRTLKSFLNGHSLQHSTYLEYTTNDRFKINFENIKIIAIVRNPYERMISELFFIKLIDITSSQDQVLDNIKKYLNKNHSYDNHKLPQYQFLIDDTNNISDKIIILKTESLRKDMIELGYNDFDIKIQSNKHYINYMSFLNMESIQLINDFYKKDFEFFNYNMLIFS